MSRIIPDKPGQTLSVSEYCIHPDDNLKIGRVLIGDGMAVTIQEEYRQLFADAGGVTFKGTNSTSPVTVLTDSGDFFGLIMPIRMGADDELLFSNLTHALEALRVNERAA